MDEIDIGYGPEFVIQNNDGDTIRVEINRTYSFGKLKTLMKENAQIPFDKQRYVCSDKRTIFDDFSKDDTAAIDPTFQNEDATTMITTSDDIPVKTNDSGCRALVTKSPQNKDTYITFKKMDGKDFIIFVKENDTIDSIMLRIQEISNIPLSQQEFVCFDVRTLSDQFWEEEYQRFEASIQAISYDMKQIRDVIDAIPFDVSSGYVPRSDFGARAKTRHAVDAAAAAPAKEEEQQPAKASHVRSSKSLKPRRSRRHSCAEESESKPRQRKQQLPKKRKAADNSSASKAKKTKTAKVKAEKERSEKERNMEFSIPKLKMLCLVKEIFQDSGRGRDMKLEPGALEVLRTVAELHLVSYFEDMQILATHCKRQTVMKKDSEILKRLKPKFFEKI